MIRRSSAFLSQLFPALDFLLIQCSFLFAWWLKFKSGWIPYEEPLSFYYYLIWSTAYGGIAIVIGYMLGFYSSKRTRRFSLELVTVLQIQSISILLLLSFFFVMKIVDISRMLLIIFVFGNIFVLSFYRFVTKQFLRKIRENGYNKRYVLIVGAGTLGRRFYANLLHYPELGYEVSGFLDDHVKNHPEECTEFKPIIGCVDDLEAVLQSEFIDEVIIALPLNAYEKIGKIIGECERAGVKTLIIPDYFDYLPARPYIENFAGIPLINVRDIPLDELRNRLMKRAFDVIFSVVCITITLPLLIMIAIGIKLTSPGPTIFKQERVGLNRRTFHMYKFRSMKLQTESDSDTKWTVENDPRRTKFGAFLRRTSLDELPQFFNVLFGHMSVVGPRPERPYFVEQFKEEIPKYMVKHHIRPGITGWAQSNGYRGDTSIAERIKHDIFYIENWTFFFDIRIILKTILNGFLNRNAY